MKPTKIDIIKKVIAAQLCSDHGKDLHRLQINDVELRRWCKRNAYKGKAYCILRAVQMHSAIPYCGIRIYVEQWLGASVIVYFIIDGRQISFHCPRITGHEKENPYIDQLRMIADRTPQNKRIRWNKAEAGSITTAQQLQQLYNI